MKSPTDKIQFLLYSQQPDDDKVDLPYFNANGELFQNNLSGNHSVYPLWDFRHKYEEKSKLIYSEPKRKSKYDDLDVELSKFQNGYFLSANNMDTKKNPNSRYGFVSCIILLPKKLAFDNLENLFLDESKKLISFINKKYHGQFLFNEKRLKTLNDEFIKDVKKNFKEADGINKVKTNKKRTSAIIFTLKKDPDMSKLKNTNSLYKEKDFFEKNLFCMYISDSYNKIKKHFASFKLENLDNKLYTMLIYEFDKDFKFETEFKKRPIFTKLSLDLVNLKIEGKFIAKDVSREMFNSLPKNFHDKNRVY